MKAPVDSTTYTVPAACSHAIMLKVSLPLVIKFQIHFFRADSFLLGSIGQELFVHIVRRVGSMIRDKTMQNVVANSRE